MNAHQHRIIIFLLFAAPVALRGAELLSSLPSNEGGDWFGRDVSISGNMALVASRHAPPPPNEQNWGIGHIFKNVVTATGTVTEHTRLVVLDNTIYGGVHIDRASLSGNMALLADWGENVAYLYKDIVGRDGTIYQSLTLRPSEQFPSGWDFGSGMSLSGTVALIGAPGAGQSSQRSGCVFVFPNLHTTNGTITEHASLRRSDATPRDGFGWSVHHDGNIGLVGYPNSTDGVTFPPGTAYLYLNLEAASGHNITETAKLFASDGQPGDYFGAAVAVSGTTGLVSATNVTGAGDRRAVYVFRNLDAVMTGPVTENLKLIASDAGSAAAAFAHAISVSGNVALVGAPYDDLSRGAAYLFRDISTASGTLTESAKIVPSDIEDGDEFGYAVSIDGDQFIVGAWQKDEPADDGWHNVGKAYTGSVSSMTLLDAGKTTKNISGLSFVSREDWVIGQTTDRNQVTLFAGDTANVTAAGKAVRIGQHAGSDHNTLHVKGNLFATHVYVGSIAGNANNKLRIDSAATFQANAFRVAPASALVLQGVSQTFASIFNRLGATALQVWHNGTWTTVTPENYTSLIDIAGSNEGTHVHPKVPPPSTADSDNDGMSDQFEQRYFGSMTGGNPDADADGDGKSNRDEYKAGTSPVDASSVFAIQEPGRSGSSFTFVFEAAPNKAYEIRSGTSLTSGFPTLEQSILATPTGGIETVTLPASGAAKFYRVVVVP